MPTLPPDINADSLPLQQLVRLLVDRYGWNEAEAVEAALALRRAARQSA